MLSSSQILRCLRKKPLKVDGLDKGYGHLTTKQTFDYIYNKGIWGKDKKGRGLSGGGSHEMGIITPYIAAVSEFLSTLPANITIIDLGCGDFNVGKNFIDKCAKYIACDISSVVLDENKKNYEAANLRFQELDLVTDNLPEGNVAFVRQVLQHLNNEEIKAFVEKINEVKPYQFLIVTEHIPAGDEFCKNIDKPTGPNIRMSLESGVDLAEEPFNLKYQQEEIICEVENDFFGKPSIIRTTLYTL